MVDKRVTTDGNITRVYSKRRRESRAGDIDCFVAPPTLYSAKKLIISAELGDNESFSLVAHQFLQKFQALWYAAFVFFRVAERMRAEASSETPLSVKRSLRVSRRSGGWNRLVPADDSLPEEM